MKKRSRKARALVAAEAPTAFARGFLVTALLATLQDRGATAAPKRKVLRHALQGGAALAAATVAAEALSRRDYPLALAAVAAGAAGVMAAESLLPPQSHIQENDLGQEA